MSERSNFARHLRDYCDDNGCCFGYMAGTPSRQQSWAVFVFVCFPVHRFFSDRAPSGTPHACNALKQMLEDGVQARVASAQATSSWRLTTFKRESNKFIM
jgi:hypothetical protein